MSARHILAGCALAVCLSGPSRSVAGYQEGLDAYAAGDYQRAMEEWQAVVEAPHTAENPLVLAESHYAIAKLYWQGQGVTRDYYAALDWLQKAADMNHAGAMARLGYLYTDGIAVRQDFGQAFEWYSKAAKLGEVDALYNLGIFYLNGWGTEQDTTMAKQYLAAAAAQNDPAAEQALRQVMAMEAAGVPVSEAAAAEPAGDAPAEGAVLASATETGEATPEPEPEPTPPAEPDPPPVLHGEDWIRAQPPDHYTIQAIGLSDRAKLESLLEGQEQLAPFAIYTVQKASRPIHVLVQGNYATVEEARTARDAFPAAINRPDRVWIRQFAKIQELLEDDA